MGQCFAQALVNGDMPRIYKGFASAVADSFVKHPMRDKIGRDAETKRRAEICARWFRVMVEQRDPVFNRLEYGYGIDRALSAIPEALEAELSGRHWAPNKTTLWVPNRRILAI